MVPLVALLLRRGPERAGIIVLSALAAHTARHWMVERGQAWWQHPLPRPNAADLSEIPPWATAAALTGSLLWSARQDLGRPMAAPEDGR